MKRRNIKRCRDLRKRQTDTERKLWKILRNRQLAEIKFRRQFSIGRYILDFYSAKYKLGIEADGGQHYEDKFREKDEQRTRELFHLGVKILRFSDQEILTNTLGVCEAILMAISPSTHPLNAAPSPHPLPGGERKQVPPQPTFSPRGRRKR